MEFDDTQYNILLGPINSQFTSHSQTYFLNVLVIIMKTKLIMLTIFLSSIRLIYKQNAYVISIHYMSSTSSRNHITHLRFNSRCPRSDFSSHFLQQIMHLNLVFFINGYKTSIFKDTYSNFCEISRAI